jgi:multidrug efflux pump subunit AcrA (membrane-fusion protein)
MPELSSFRLTTRVDETERRRLSLQQSASVRVDAIADSQIAASVAQISTLARPDYSMVPPPKNFDIEMELKGGDSRLRPGMSANAQIVVDRIPNSILVPVEALFQKQGHTVVYVSKRGRFQERVVQVQRRGLADAIITAGLAPGEKVALKDPTEDSQENQ